MTDPIRKTLSVPLPPDDAFRLFAEQIDRWWPKDSHSTSANEQAVARRVDIEPRKGGQITETRHDGHQTAWGHVTHWEPGRRLAFDWHPGRDPAQATQVDVRFVTDAVGCQVSLVHDGFDRLGRDAARMHAGYTTGWDLVLGCFARAARKLLARA